MKTGERMQILNVFENVFFFLKVKSETCVVFGKLGHASDLPESHWDDRSSLA